MATQVRSFGVCIQQFTTTLAGKKKQNKRKSPKTITRKSATSVLLLFFCFFQTGGSGKKMKTNSLTKKRELLNGIRHELTLVSQRHWTSSGWKWPRSGQLQIITKKKKRFRNDLMSQPIGNSPFVVHRRKFILSLSLDDKERTIGDNKKKSDATTFCCLRLRWIKEMRRRRRRSQEGSSRLLNCAVLANSTATTAAPHPTPPPFPSTRMLCRHRAPLSYTRRNR